VPAGICSCGGLPFALATLVQEQSAYLLKACNLLVEKVLQKALPV